MSVFVVPPIGDDDTLWPTLGPQVWDWMLEACVYGPGDLRGRPLDGGLEATPEERKAFLGALAEFRAVVFRAYQIFPRVYPATIFVDGQEKRHPKAGQPHPKAGRRRFKRVGVSWRKGTAKTEKGGWIAAAELSPSAPVRFGGWDANGQPVGTAVRDPYIPLVAYAEEQVEELGFAVVKTIVEESDYLLDELDPWKSEVVRKEGDGKAVALAGSPNARDGARTTFQFFDETHRMVLEKLVGAHQTMLANIPKRPLADPWSLETTTAYEPGAGSVAEGTFDYARKIAAGESRDPSLFFFHRQASDDIDVGKAVKAGDEATLLAAVSEASGPAAKWSDLDYIVALGLNPQTDLAYWERVWLNRLRQGGRQAFDIELVKTLLRERALPAKGGPITLGFDGSRSNDATGLVATDLLTGWQWPVAVWERPLLAKPGEWEVPEDEVDAAVARVFSTWDVWRMYADPYYWEQAVVRWVGRYGDKRVVPWATAGNARERAVAMAVKTWTGAMKGGDWTFGGEGETVAPDGNTVPLVERYLAHLGHARKRDAKLEDPEDGQPLYVLSKERRDSPDKIDLAMAGLLSWEAYRDGVAAGANRPKRRGFVAF